MKWQEKANKLRQTPQFHLAAAIKNRSKKKQSEIDLFRSRLDNIINMRHELVLLADKIDWAHLDREVAVLFAGKGRPALPTRLMVGLYLLKEIDNLSDEQVCANWITNPYYQYFCGETYFQHKLVLDRTSLTR